MNALYYGDCLTIMRDLPAGEVDLIYLDPPFNSNREYNAIYQDETGRPLPDQIEAFSDTWELDEGRMRAIRDLPILMAEHGIGDEAIGLVRAWLPALARQQPRMGAYISYMAERLVAMRRLLKPSGSLFLHADPTASHYLKVLLDMIFGADRFLNEIIWRRTNAKGLATRRLATNHDVILRYGMSAAAKWTPQYTEHDPEYVQKFYRHVEPETGRRYQLGDLTNPNKDRPNLTYEFLGVTRVWRWTRERMQRAYDDGLIVQSQADAVPRLKRYLDEQRGTPVDDIWDDVLPVQPNSGEDMKYATQKPLALLERIVDAATEEGDLVLDPFCGCATTLEAAHRLGRRWIGIDIAIHAVQRVAKVRLGDRCGLSEGVNFTVDGIPRNVEGARLMWESDPYQFQKWAVEQIDGFVTAKRTADGGIDGRLYFAVPGEEALQSMVLEVKGGEHVSISHLRALSGVLEADDALQAGLITMVKPSERQMRNFQRLIAEVGDIEVLGNRYPRLQVLSVEEILQGERFRTPSPAARGSAQKNMPLDI